MCAGAHLTDAFLSGSIASPPAPDLLAVEAKTTLTQLMKALADLP